MNLRTLASGNRFILYDADHVAHPQSLPFDHSDADDAEPVVGEGRGGIWRVRMDDLDLALREYRRGGLVRHFIRATHLWTGVGRTRAFREFRLLAELWGQGLPVPRPLATRVVRRALWYRAELLTVWIPGARSLVTLLSESERDASLWAEVGRVIRRFHDAGVDHADLNAHNILVDGSGDVYLVDLDRGRRRRPAPGWQRANLSRLRHSLEKVHATGRALYFTADGWDALLSGYTGQPPRASP